MNYKYITGDNLEITSSGWSEGTVLQDIYPDSSFVSGVENPQSMKMVPIIRDQKYMLNIHLRKDLREDQALFMEVYYQLF